jgi:hypothetical protein
MNGRHVRTVLALLLVIGLGLTEASSQTVQTQRVMREKLTRSQQLLGDVVTGNWVALNRDVTALEELTKDPSWGVMRMPEYSRQSAQFLRALEDLQEAAARRDGAAAPLAYVSLTLSCVRCHQDIARARLAR